MFPKKFFPLIAAIFGAIGCGSSTFVDHALYATNEPIVFRIGYMPGTEVTLPLGIAEWAEGQPPVAIADFVCHGAAALFPGRACLAPRTISEMHPLERLSFSAVYDRDTMRRLAATIPGNPSDQRVIVLDGVPSFDQGSCEPGTACILGHTTVKQDGQRVIALFLPNIAKRSNQLRGGYPYAFYFGYVFAATWTHEFGHAAGLVDNDVPMATDHDYPGDGHHCGNSNCIMAPDPLNRSAYTWSMERAGSGAAADNGFDPDCIQDVRAARAH